MKKYNLTDVAFYVSFYTCKASGCYPVYYSEIQEELKYGFTIEEIKKMYKH
jgi:hypothetical protein